MEFWLKQDKEELRLPVNPANYAISSIQQNTAANIIGYGEVNLLGKRGLKSITLATIFPTQAYDFCQYKKFPKPLQCVKMINGFKESGAPVRIIITGAINMLATVENFEYGESDGTRDINFSLELKEYRKPVLKQIKKKKEPIKKEPVKKEPTKEESKKEKKPDKEREKTTVTPPETARDTKKVKSTIYIVKKGDTLMGIAKKITGNSSNWVAIKKKNKIKDVRKLQIGTKLTIDVS